MQPLSLPNCLSLPYLERHNKLSALQPLLEQPWTILLDSAGEDLNYNRFDILCTEPSIQLTFKSGQLVVNSAANIKLSAELEIDCAVLDQSEPLKMMQVLLSQFKEFSSWTDEQYSNISLPFYGGWLGYISYDFGRFLETLPTIAKDDIELPELRFGLYQWAIITDHKLKTTNIYNFGLNEQDWQNLSQKTQQMIKENQEASLSEFSLTSEWQSNTSEQDYNKAFSKVKNYITQGDCYQVNYAQRFEASYQGDSLAAYGTLTKANQAPFSSFMNFDDYQILSLSPERFIECHHDKVITQPIKGTRPRSADPEIDKSLADELMNSEKDRAENLMIVDLLRNDLSRTAAKGSVKVSELFGHYRFESVHHLISTVESKLGDKFNQFDLLATTLPGGSITGAPKIRAMEIIEELEPVRRNIYCGVIGYIDFCGNMDTNICIRTLIAQQNKLYCWAGGGLVADSEADKEYQETFDKLAKILPVLNEMSCS